MAPTKPCRAGFHCNRKETCTFAHPDSAPAPSVTVKFQITNPVRYEAGAGRSDSPQDNVSRTYSPPFAKGHMPPSPDFANLYGARITSPLGKAPRPAQASQPTAPPPGARAASPQCGPASRKEHGPANGRITKIESSPDRPYGFIDVGHKSSVYFALKNCYAGAAVGHLIIVTWYESSDEGDKKKFTAKSVIRDEAREELHAMGRMIRDITGGAANIDPDTLDAVAMKELLTSVKLKVKEQELRRARAIRAKIGEIERASHAQVAFLLDCTGSMSSYIEASKEAMTAIRDKAVDVLPSANVTCAFVGYRDHGDEAVPTLNFTDSEIVFKSHLARVAAEGGDDQAEDVYSGLQAIAALSWDAQIPTKLLFHIGDAPTHGIFFAEGKTFGDNSPSFDSNGSMSCAVLKKICHNFKVQYFFLKINSSTDPMISVYNRLLNSKEGVETIFTEKLKNAASIIDIAVAKTSTAIFASHTAASVNVAVDGASHATYHVELAQIISTKEAEASRRVTAASIAGKSAERVPRKADINVGIAVPGKPGSQCVEVFSSTLPCSLDALSASMTCPDFKAGSRERHMKIDDSAPFSKGGQRQVCLAVDTTFEETTEYVLKTHMEARTLADEEWKAKMDLETQAIAAFLAQEFCTLTASPKSVRYLKAKAIKFKDTRGRIRFATIEKILSGEYLKWSSNAAYSRGEDDPEFSATLGAFSHWTYVWTKQYLMVVDVQGIKLTDKEFVLTDPAIHCTDLARFGETNLGDDGFGLFFEGHNCNHICKKLALPRHPKQRAKKIFYVK